MHGGATWLFDWSSWISARFRFQGGIRRFGYKSNLPNMAMSFLVAVGVHNKMTYSSSLPCELEIRKIAELWARITQCLIK